MWKDENLKLWKRVAAYLSFVEVIREEDFAYVYNAFVKTPESVKICEHFA